MKQIKELIRFRDVSMFYKKVVWKRYSNSHHLSIFSLKEAIDFGHLLSQYSNNQLANISKSSLFILGFFFKIMSISFIAIYHSVNDRNT